MLDRQDENVIQKKNLKEDSTPKAIKESKYIYLTWERNSKGWKLKNFNNQFEPVFFPSTRAEKDLQRFVDIWLFVDICPFC